MKKWIKKKKLKKQIVDNNYDLNNLLFDGKFVELRIIEMYNVFRQTANQRTIRSNFLQAGFTLELAYMTKNEIKLKQKRIDVLGTYQKKITKVKFDEKKSRLKNM